MLNKRISTAIFLLSCSAISEASSYRQSTCEYQINKLLNPSKSFVHTRTHAEARIIYQQAIAARKCLKKWHLDESKPGLIRKVKHRIRALVRAEPHEWVAVLQKSPFVTEADWRQYALQLQAGKTEMEIEMKERERQIVTTLGGVIILVDGQEVVVHKDGL